MSDPYDLLVCGDLILPDRRLDGGWIAIAGERIAAIGSGRRPPALRVHDAGRRPVLPGFVDGQTHATSYRGLPGFEATSRSALAGGVTTMVDMPYDNPDPLNTLERLEHKIEAIGRFSHCDVALYATIAPGQGTAAMLPLAKAGVAAFKISSFESHPVRFPRLPANDMLAILEASVETGLPVGLHNEDQEIVRAAVERMKAQGRTTPEWHEPSRPFAAEMAATAAFLELGAATGAHVHLVHISAGYGYDLVARAREAGVHATAELCVHYLHFDAARDLARLGARMKVNPPLRAGAVDGLWRALAEGKVAFISSDHSSWPVDNKLTASIFDAGAGIPGLETMAPSLFTDAQARVADPVALLATQLSEAPAKFFGLWPRKGAIAVGADADLAILHLEDTVFDASQTRDGLNWSPYDGERFGLRVATTVLRGAIVWDGETVLATPGQGCYVPRPTTTAAH